MSETVFAFPTATGTHAIAAPIAALRLRGELPGASGYDRAAHLFRKLQFEGATALDLLPAVFPNAWMVNARATSHTFAAWSAMSETWDTLLTALPFDGSLFDFASLDHDAIEKTMWALCTAPGATLTSLTKVLALLRPQLVPIAHDKVVAVVTGRVAMPTSSDTETCTLADFKALFSWFAKNACEKENELIALARNHELATLDAPQVLDRLLWSGFCDPRHAHAVMSAP